MIGGARDILVARTSGLGTVVADVDTSVLNSFAYSSGASTRGTALIQWDGNDGSCTLNPTGLGDISLAPDDGIAMFVQQVDLNGVVQMRIYTDGSNYSTFNYVIPTAIGAPGRLLYFPFEQFTAVGLGADFAHVGAIEVFVDGTTVDSLDMTLDFVNTDLTRDFGDLPAAYNNITLFANNGARHTLGSVYLGLGIDADVDGQTSPNATGDNTNGTNDEQGVDAVTGSNWGDGGGQFSVNATVPAADIVACLVGWIDWDNSGSFDVGGTTGGVSELVYNSFVFTGSSSHNITTPTAAIYGGTYPATLNARFRVFQRNADLFTTLGLTLDGFGCPSGESEANIHQLLNGLARNGEVEDYQWGFSPTAVTLQSITADNHTNTNTLVGLVGILVLALVSVGYIFYRRQASN